MNIPTQFTDDSHYQNTIIKHSRRLVGYFNYGTDSQRMDFGSLQHRNKNGFADCSSLVWLVMKQAGYKTLWGSQMTTPYNRSVSAMNLLQKLFTVRGKSRSKI